MLSVSRSKVPARSRRGRILLAIATALGAAASSVLLAAPASAADITVPGSIRDENGRPIANGFVAVHNIELNVDVFMTTDAEGLFSFTFPSQTSVQIRVDAFHPIGFGDTFMSPMPVNRQARADFIEGFTTPLTPTIMGTEGDDIITGTDGDDVILALDGNDTIDSGLGRDVIISGAGSDSLTGGDGRDTLSGGDGTDLLAGGAGNDFLWGGHGNDRLRGEAGDDTVGDYDFGDGPNRLFGGAGDDNVSVSWPAHRGSPISHSVISGGAGNDTIGANGPDVDVRGGLGDDVISLATGNTLTYTVDCGDGVDVVNPNFNPPDNSHFTACETIQVIA